MLILWTLVWLTVLLDLASSDGIVSECTGDNQVCWDRQYCDNSGQLSLHRSNKLTFGSDKRRLQVGSKGNMNAVRGHFPNAAQHISLIIPDKFLCSTLKLGGRRGKK